MGSYVNSLLTGDERVVYETKISLFEFVPYIFAMIVGVVVIAIAVGPQNAPLAVGGVIVWCLVVGFLPWLRRKCSEFVVTSRRVIMKTGIISRNVFEMRLQKIESVDLAQSIPGRVFGYGTVTVHGTGDTARTFSMIADPVRFRHEIDLACEESRKNAGN